MSYQRFLRLILIVKEMKKITDLARHLSGFFTEYLPATRNLSRNTIKAYRDTFRLLLVFFREVHTLSLIHI